MGEQTAIEWTDHTFNPWWGCQKISPACANCYAEGVGARFGGGERLWGRDHGIRTFGDEHWNDPIRWNRKAEKAGVSAKVFCGSMCDVFEARADLVAHRNRLWRLIGATPHLTWLLLTKRPELAQVKVPARWLPSWNGEWPSNVWIGTTVEDQQRADERIPHLLRIPAPVRFLSCEPLLGPVDLGYWLEILDNCSCGWRGEEQDHDECPECGGTLITTTGQEQSDRFHSGERYATAQGERDVDGWEPISWVIAGGESGPRSRPSHPEWFRSLRDQCTAAGVPFFLKQMNIGGTLTKMPALDGRQWMEVPDAD